jgi:FAD/FMN-containing dehydrogenase
LRRDRATRDLFLEVTSQIPAHHTKAELTKLTFTADNSRPVPGTYRYGLAVVPVVRENAGRVDEERKIGIGISRVEGGLRAVDVGLTVIDVRIDVPRRVASADAERDHVGEETIDAEGCTGIPRVISRDTLARTLRQVTAVPFAPDAVQLARLAGRDAGLPPTSLRQLQGLFHPLEGNPDEIIVDGRGRFDDAGVYDGDHRIESGALLRSA